jgi:hypothetical protein
VTAYSLYWQLTSVTGGSLLHPQPEDEPCYNDKKTHLTVCNKEPECVLNKFHIYSYYMQSLVGDFNAKVDMEDIFNHEFGICLFEISNDKGVSAINFATYKS